MNFIERLRITAVIIVLFFTLASAAKSNLTVQLKEIDPSGITVESKDYPVYYSYMKVLKDGNPVTISGNDITVVHDNYISRPFEALPPDGNGWQKVSWNAAQVEYDYLSFFVTYQDETGYQVGRMVDKGMAVIVIRDENNLESPEMNFGIVKPGDQVEKKVQLSVARNFTDGDKDLNVRLDSVSVEEPFSYNWLGASINTKEPPIDMVPGFSYRLFVDFAPKDTMYYQKKLKIYYEGGLSQYVNLIGNFYEIPSPTLLNVVKPNGGEIIAPCMNYQIKWKGQVKDLPTKVEYSINGGYSWQLIDYVTDSVYNWKVPLLPSDRALIRVSQGLKQDKIKNLVNDRYPVRKVTYDSDGYNVLTYNEKGYIWEWNIYDMTSSDAYIIDENLDYPSTRILPTGIDYYDNNTKFAASYDYYFSSGSIGNAEVAFFEKDNFRPVKKFKLPSGFLPVEMKIDPARKNLIFRPYIGSELLVVPIDNPDNFKYIRLGKPISAFDVNNQQNKVTVAFYNGDVEILSLPDYNVTKTIDFSDLPVISQIALAPNGKFLGIACSKPVAYTTFKSNKNESHVYDLETGMIVRTHRASASEPVGVAFNPVSSVMVIGSEANPQISLWDLPSDEYIGDLTGHNQAMTDFKMSPDGHSIATSSVGSDNAKVRIFTYPEFDRSDNVFEIGDPQPTIDTADFGSEYYMTETEKEFDTQLCNYSKVPIVLPQASFKHGMNFSLRSDFILPDTLYPGDCLSIPMIFNPKDTGLITDTLGFITCMGYLDIPVLSYSLQRNIQTFMPYDFGKACLGDFVDKEIDILKNNDPVDLVVNDILVDDYPNSPYTILSHINDTIIKPGQTLRIKVRFKPKELNGNPGSLQIFHSNALKFPVKVELNGTGIGAKLDLSHKDLRFIPEILTRTVTIENQTDNNVSIVGYTADPPGIFDIITPLPVNLDNHGKADIEIRWNGQPTDDVTISLDAAPCVANADIVCGVYNATAAIKAVDTTADPRGNASIPFSYSLNEKKAYNGSRFFEAEFSINPRMFLPESVFSEYGTGSLTKNSIEGDRRIVGFRVEGNFPSRGIIAEVRGIAGIAETDTTSVIVDPNSVFWGTSTNVIPGNGMFRLINLCGGRRVIQPSASVQIESISPNPASNSFSLNFRSNSGTGCSVELFDRLGNTVSGAITVKPSAGVNNININTASLNTGIYTIVIKQGTSFDSGSILIVR